jgi:hypothetical protein
MVWRLSYDLLSLENSSCFHMTDTFSYDFIWLLLILKQEESSCFLYDFSSHKLFKGKQSWIIFSETNPKWNKPWSNINTNYSTYPNLFICIAQFLQNLCRRRQRSLFGPPHQYLRYVRLVWIISVWRLCTWYLNVPPSAAKNPPTPFTVIDIFICRFLYQSCFILQRILSAMYFFISASKMKHSHDQR